MEGHSFPFQALGTHSVQPYCFFGDLYAKEEVSALLYNAHARRKFEATTKNTKKIGLAHHAMSVYAKLYAIISLIRSTKLHKLDPFQYYVKVLEIIPYRQTAEDYEAFLPRNIDLEKVAAPD